MILVQHINLHSKQYIYLFLLIIFREIFSTIKKLRYVLERATREQRLRLEKRDKKK